ncbi:ABC transporter permease [Romboutsia weinsteinii]|uniref:ABC transporter permease n=1 Tax=Romboutsia weinsteinii TaxID=2020949 RepID=A0A371J629_9FIRM|nr:ABC transporter permease [Romboutsia weinsteinii]RDY28240.1 ABC transporter permease [Romboutsia weinsteinii]
MQKQIHRQDKKTEISNYRKRNQMVEVWSRLKKNKMAMLGLVIIIILLLLAIFADVIADYDTLVVKQNIMERLQPPSKKHIFGTDEFGRDIFSRIVHGSRISIKVGVISVAMSLILGGLFGSIAGYYGGKTDNIIMRLMDILLAVPSILLAITIVAAFGTNLINVIIALGIAGIPKYARIVRAAVLGVKDQEFIESARAIGATDATIILREVIPNCLSPIIVQVTLSVAGVILSIASLSFIGLGIQPPEPEWGAMLSGGRQYLRDAWHITVFPGLAIMITILALNLLGDGLRDALDPRLKQ